MNKRNRSEADHDSFADFLDELGVDAEDDPYQDIDQTEIAATRSTDPMRADLMELANENLEIARAQAEGEKERIPKHHEMGWYITIQTDNGLVGVWNCWLGNRLFIGYPKKFKVPDDLIKDTLQVEDSYPVEHYDATAVNDWEYEGRYKDPDIPLEQNEHGQIVAYHHSGQRQWGDFFGPLTDLDKGGRVWIEHVDRIPNGIPFEYVDDHSRVKTEQMGHSRTRNIFTPEFSQKSRHSFEAPTTDPDAIQQYRERFIELAVKIAEGIGEVESVNIDYGELTFVPEDLEREGFTDIKWIKGNWGQRKGFGQEQVMARKDNMTVV